MRRLVLCLTVCGAAALSSSAFAQTTTTTVVEPKPSNGAAVGVVGGAATGAAVGGPVGAVVGGVVGGIAGALTDPPAEVRTYVQSQNAPVVTYQGQLVAGQPLPAPITVYDIPSQPRYSWAYVNGQRVVVERSNRHIIGVVPESTTTTTTTTTRPSGGAAAGAVTGAATGAVVGGPVGAAVGAVVGAVGGALADPPAQVTTYVRSQKVEPVTYSGQIAVGQPFPTGVAAYDVPSDPRYRWSFVNGQRVLIDRNTQTIVTVLP